MEPTLPTPTQGVYVLRMFGALTLEGGGLRQTRFPTRKSALLLASLAVARGQRVGRDELAALLWPDDYLDQTRTRLRQELRRLRQVVGEFGACVRADRQWVEIEPGTLTTDIQAFDQAIAESNATEDLVARAAGLYKAVELLNGPFLAGYQEPWVHATRRNYDEKARRTWLALADALQALGSDEEALDATINAVRHDPLDSDANASLIRRLVERGQAARARQAFLEYDAMMLRELGRRAPMSVRASFAVSVTDQLEDPAEPDAILRGAIRRPSTLFGRDDLLKSIEEALAEPSSCILAVGTVGVGKTHLLREAAWRFSRAKGLPVQFGGIPDRVADGLFVIDTTLDAKQLSPAIIDAVQNGWRVLAESRLRLDLDGVPELAINPLPVPAPGDQPETVFKNPSIQILLSQSTDQSAERTDAGALGHLSELARRLDGLPSALRYCSSRLLTQPPEQILSTLDSTLTEFVEEEDAHGESVCSALIQMASQLPPHVLEAFLSLCILEGASRDLACRLSAPHDCAEVWRMLERRSLICVQDTGHRRFRVPSAIAHAARKIQNLRDSSTTVARTWQTVADWAFEKSRHLTGPNQDPAFTAIEVELENLRLGITWASGHDAQLAAYLVVGAWRTICARGKPSNEGDLLLPAIQRGAHFLAPALCGEAWIGTAIVQSVIGDLAAAERTYLRGIDLYEAHGDNEGAAWGMMNYAANVLTKTDLVRAQILLKKAADRTTSPNRRALAMSDYANTLARTGEIDEALRVAEEVFAARIQFQDLTAIARAYVDLGGLYLEIGRKEAARPLFMEGIRKLREAGIQNMLLDRLITLAELDLTAEDVDWPFVAATLDEAETIAARIGAVARLLEISRARLRLASLTDDRPGFVVAAESMFKHTQTMQSTEERVQSLRVLATELQRHGKTLYANAILGALDDSVEGLLHAGWKALLSSKSHDTICVLAPVMAKEALG